MQSKFKLSFIAAVLAFSFGAHAHEAKKLGGLTSPESVAVAADGQIYVPDIGAFGKDGDGQISVVDADGTLRVFSTGLDDPKGIYFFGKPLFVSDNNRVIKTNQQTQWTTFAATHYH